MEDVHRPARRNRRIARGSLIAAGILVVATVAFLLRAPNTMGPSPSPFGSGVTWLGLAGMIGGLVWMIRIDRAARDPERRRTPWRSHR